MVDVGSAQRQRWAELQAQRAAQPKIPSLDLAEQIDVGPTRALAKRNDLFGVPDERSLFDENTDDWKYIGQRAGRGVADLAAGFPDLGSAAYNLGATGFDWLTGMESPRLGYLSDTIADKATELTGADIIPDDAVQTSAGRLGGLAQLGIGASAGPETLLPYAASKGASWLAKGGRALEEAAPVGHDLFWGGGQAFHDAVAAGKRGNRFGPAVELKAPEDYDAAGMKLFLAPDQQSGFAIKPDGDLVSVFSNKRGRLADMMNTSARWGASKLDAFDLSPVTSTSLPEMYGRHGYEETWRAPWNNDYRPPDWEDWLGTPDVVGMQRWHPQAPRSYSGEGDSLFRRPAPTRQMF